MQIVLESLKSQVIPIFWRIKHISKKSNLKAIKCFPNVYDNTLVGNRSKMCSSTISILFRGVQGGLGNGVPHSKPLPPEI